MSYFSGVGTCRFYINIVEWARSIYSEPNEFPIGSDYMDSGTNVGHADNDILDLFNTMPTKYLPVHRAWCANMPLDVDSNQGFIAILGHLISTEIRGGFYTTSAGDVVLPTDEVEEIVNSGTGSADTIYDGFSIRSFNTLGKDNIGIRIQNESGNHANANISSLIIGNYFDMPNSSDLSLNLSFETGTKTIETKGGASISNLTWRPPMWGAYAPWDIVDPHYYSESGTQSTEHAPGHYALEKSSRKIWDLSFSFLSESNVFPKYNSFTALAEEPGVNNNQSKTLIGSDDFFSRVYNVVGTNLPFIFQPDISAKEFAICKFVKNLSVRQVSNKTYSCSLKLREVW